MKKWIKYLIIAIGIALFLFLLLPFLEPPATGDASARYRVIPQIFTVNPLTRLARRLASLWTTRPAVFASAHALGGRENLGVRAAGSGVGMMEGPEDVFFDEEEEYEEDVDIEDGFLTARDDATASSWVLIRQRRPEGARSGMHEINADEDAYERYMKQAQLARLMPPKRSSNRTRTEKDSQQGWFVSPIERFFGFGTETFARSGMLVGWQDRSSRAHRMGETEGMDRNKAKQARQFIKGEKAEITGNELKRIRLDLHKLGLDKDSEWFDSEKLIEDAAGMVTQFKRGLEPDEQESFQQARRDEFVRLWGASQLAWVNNLAAGRQAVDRIEKTFSCDSSKGTVQESSQCFPPEEYDLAVMRQQNQARFKEATGLDMPSKVIPVLSIADPATSAKLEPSEKFRKIDPEDYYRRKFYQYMLTADNSQTEKYWAAVPHGAEYENESGIPTLDDIIKGSGTEISGEVVAKRARLAQQFVAQQYADLPDEERRQVMDYVRSVPYVIVSDEDLSREKAILLGSAETFGNYVKTHPLKPLVLLGDPDKPFDVEKYSLSENVEAVSQATIDSFKHANEQRGIIRGQAAEQALRNMLLK